MEFDIKNKVALIGGSSKGLGKACAVSLAKEGCRLIICARNSDSLENTKQELIALGAEVLALEVDMSLEEDNHRIVKEAVEKFGSIDILINNSGGPKPGTFKALSDADWDQAYNSVLKYNIRMIRLCLPLMERQAWGRIINITSLSVKEPSPSLLLSNVFRAGVTSLAKSLSKDLINKGITINNICPGAFETDRAVELMKNKAKETGETFEEIKRSSAENLPQKRYQKPEELGDLVCFLASNKASSITGTSIQIDGGISNSLF